MNEENERFVKIDVEEARCIADSIEEELIDHIRSDPELDNLDWLATVMGLYKKCRDLCRGK